MNHADEQIMILAMLNGNWDTAGFRYLLACKHQCLEVLINDRHSMISDIAKRNVIRQSKERAKELGIIK